MSTPSTNSTSTSELDQLRDALFGLKKACKQILPKVNPSLIADFIERLQKNPEPIYIIEIFTKSGLDSERIRTMMFEKIGVSPEIYENGTQYVINHKLNFEMLKVLSDNDDVVAVEGDYTETITGLGPSHNWDEVRARIGDRDYYKYQY